MAAFTAGHSDESGRPKLVAPPNAVDCHVLIYDRRFPTAPGVVSRPPEAHVDAYRILQQRLGTTRAVVVTPSAYGVDNSCTLDALQQLGAAARAVAVVDTIVTDAELKHLDNLGVRAIRFNLVYGDATSLDMVEPLSKRVNDLGWHVQIHMTADQIAQSEGLLARLPAPILFDHQGHIPRGEGECHHPALTAIRRLLDAGRTWVKLSAPYQDSKVGPPTYADVALVAKALVKAAPERMLWGSNWPHPTQKADARPDDVILFDLVADWAPEPRLQELILVRNPALLFGFPFDIAPGGQC